MTGLFLGEVSL